MSDAKAGSQIGAYVLDWRLGGGSFGEVWRGHEAASGEPVAVKLLTGMLSTPNNAAMRAEVETLAAAAAGRSEHVVKVLGGGSEPTPYIVMEYVEGSDLSALLKDGGRLSSEKTIDIGIGVSRALAALNDAGIVHRDIKPANVMVDNRGVVKLADFGIAKIVGYETVTMTGQVAMTMAYAAPEVWDDDSPFGRPSHRSDLYALGILLFQCLTGETPFRGNYGALYRQHTERPPDLSALPVEAPASLRQLVRQCLEKRPTSRPADALACLVMLERAQAELKERRQGGISTEPSRFGQWVKLSPHATQPWAWHCRHEGTQQEATVEVQFSDDLEHGTQLRKAISASPKLVAHGGERVIETNRLLMRPGESWQAAPKGMYQFWVAREDLPQVAATLVSVPMLHTATLSIANLLADAAWEGLSLSVGAEDLSVLGNGGIYLRRPGLTAPISEASEQALATLRTLPLDTAAREFIARATSFDSLVQLFGSQGTPPSVQDDATSVWSNATQIAPAALGATTFVSSAAPSPAPSEIPPVVTPRELPAAPVAPVAAAAASLSALALQLIPTGGKKAGEYDLVLHNTGALPMQVMLDAFDSDGSLAFQLPPQVMVRESASQRVRLQVSARKRVSRAMPFTVAAAGAGGIGQPPITVDGMFEPQGGNILPFVGAAVAAIAVAAIVGFLLLAGGKKDDTVKSASGTSPGGAANGDAVLADFSPTPPVATPAPVSTPGPQPTPEPVVIPPPTPEPAAAPIIRTCDQIRGTPYQSEEEHQFFIANCSTPPTPVRNTGGGASGGGSTGGGAGAGAGAGGGGVVAPVATPVPVVVPPTPVPVAKPVSITSVTCKSSIGTATVSNVAPASSQTGRMNAAPNDTISCSASVSGDYTSLAWTGPQNSGSAASFSTQVGGAKPGGAPYDVALQVNWNGNPPIVHFAITIDASAGGGSGNCKIVNGVQACIAQP